MLCPKKFHNYPALWECEEDKCAQWDKVNKECSYLSILGVLEGILHELEEISRIRRLAL